MLTLALPTNGTLSQIVEFAAALAHYFSREKSRLHHSGALNLKGVSDDKHITVYYDTIPEGYALHVICEYLTTINLDLYGHLHRTMIS